MILAFGLSPALQRTLRYQGFGLGKVNRSPQAAETVGGKVINTARVTHQLGLKTRFLTVIGGPHGRLVREILKAERLPGRFIAVRGHTRLCQTLIDEDGITELVEEAAPLRREETRAVFQAFERTVARAKMLVLAGSVPPGCGDDFYARLLKRTRNRDLPVLVDTQGSQLLNTLRCHPFLVRVNSFELAAATGRDCEDPAGLRAAARALLGQGTSWVIVSAGPGEVLVCGDQGRQTWSLRPPVVKVVNPIGSGDAMMAGLASVLLGGGSMLEAARWGVACGSANALTPTAGRIRRADAKRLAERVRVTAG